MDIKVTKASFNGFGVKVLKDKVYLAAALDFLSTSGINIYDLKSHDKLVSIEFDKNLFTGDVVSVYLDLKETDKLAYLFFEDDKEVIDPYCKSFNADLSLCLFEKFINPKGFDSDLKPCIPYDKSVFYLASVRGLTMLDSSIKSSKGTFKAMEEKIGDLKKLGITGLILMPVYEVFNPESSYREEKDVKKANFWGFGEGCHFAVKSSLAFKNTASYEYKSLIYNLHKNNMECIQILQFSEKFSKDYILDVLKFYLLEFHVDGFRLIGQNLPITDIVNNSLFKETKIICDNFDFEGYRPLGNFKFKNLASSNDYFLKEARKFLKGDEDTVPYFGYAVRENRKYYESLRFITDFSGFSLNDLVSYNIKHNEANNEENGDGTDYNYSWNCGEEGKSSKRTVNALRNRQVRNAMLLTLLNQGAPVLRGGDEYLNTQFGNNNPYCQDNETGWAIYRKDKTAKDFYRFLKNLLAFRTRHVILHQPKELMLFDYMSCKVPDVSFHGTDAFKMDQTPVSREFSVLYYGDYSKQFTGQKEDSIFIVYNMNWEARDFSMPLSIKDYTCKLLYSSDGSTDESFDEEKAEVFTETKYTAKGRSVTIFLFTK